MKLCEPSSRLFACQIYILPPPGDSNLISLFAAAAAAAELLGRGSS